VESSGEASTSAADQALITGLGALDLDDHALLQAFDKAIATGAPILAVYGYPSPLKDSYEWRTSAQPDWGFLNIISNNAHYIGEISNQKPHRQGTMQFSTGDTVTGSFF
jgi:hypothetical protein